MVRSPPRECQSIKRVRVVNSLCIRKLTQPSTFGACRAGLRRRRHACKNRRLRLSYIRRRRRSLAGQWQQHRYRRSERPQQRQSSAQRRHDSAHRRQRSGHAAKASLTVDSGTVSRLRGAVPVSIRISLSLSGDSKKTRLFQPFSGLRPARVVEGRQNFPANRPFMPGFAGKNLLSD